MRALIADSTDSRARWAEVPEPTAGRGQVRIAVEAAGINRADLLQIKGLYPRQLDTDRLGLECSGVVVDIGAGVDEAWLNRKVCALVPGGGLAESVVCSPQVLVSVPDGLELSLAAGLCETWCTALLNLWDQATLKPKERVLIHAGSSGVGVAAVQLTRLLGATPYVTAGSEEKLAYCQRLGAASGASRHQDWAAFFRGQGLQFDVILDPVGAGYLEKNLSVAAGSARICLIGLLGGVRADANLMDVLAKNITLFGRTLRTQPDTVKRRLLAELETIVWPAISRGRVHHCVEQIYSPDEIDLCYQRMQAGESLGKSIVVLK